MSEDQHLEGADLIDSLGSRVGVIHRVYRDEVTQHLSWAGVDTDDGPRFVPLRESQHSGRGLGVPFTTDQIVQAPELDPEAGHLSADDEAELYEHYGLDHPLPFTGSTHGTTL